MDNSHSRTLRPRTVRWQFLSLCALAGLALPSLVNAQLPGFEVIPLGSGNYNRLTLHATIEGKPAKLVLDTGAGGTFLGDGKFGFLRTGPDRQPPSGVPKTITANRTRMSVGYVRDFRIGNANLGAFPLGLVPERDLYDGKLGVSADAGHSFDGIVGEDLLRHFNAVLDVGRLVLYLSTDPKKRTNAGRALVAAGWTRVPMADYNRDFTVECSLNQKRFRLIVDTGSPFTVLDDHTVRGAQLRITNLPLRWGVVETRAQEVALVLTNSLTIGTYVATGVHMLSQPEMHTSLQSSLDESVPVVGLLGGDVLRRHNALIDIGNKALYLKPPSAAR